MRRRGLLALIGGAAWAAPLQARAQQPPRRPVIGYLGAGSPVQFAGRLGAFRRGLSESGYDEGRNVAIEYRWAEGHYDRLPALAADLVRHRVDVIAAPGNVASALAAKAATSTIPIVFEMGADPIGAGLVTSLSRPGGNLTGVTSLNAELGAKRLELLHELVPGAASIALLINPTSPNVESVTTLMRAAADATRLQLHVLHASAEREFDSVFETLAQLRVGGLVIAADIFYANHSKQLAALTARHGVLAIGQSREFAEAGGLMSYGGVWAETHRQAGIYVGRVLKGEKPADLPIQQVARFEMLINLKAARSLGVTVPPSLLARADEVIE